MGFDLSDVINKVRKNINDERLSTKIGVGSDLHILTENDFIKLGLWWSEPTGLPGIPKGRITLVGGTEDTGKTSMAIQVTKAALEQGLGVIYAETENKTTEKDFISWGVDPSQILLIQSSIAEELFTLLFQAWDSFKEVYPDVPLLVIIDSLGNVISQRDADIDLTEQSSMPGGKGKVNRLGVNKITAKASDDGTTLFLVSYTYDNLGSVGKTIAGGRALGLLSSLIYQTSRGSWYEKMVKGKKERFGANVIWTLVKNHVNKENPGLKKIEFRITALGIEFIGEAKEGKEGKVEKKAKKEKPVVITDDQYDEEFESAVVSG